MQAVIVKQHGGTDVLQVGDIATPEAGALVRVKVEWAGVNFVDIYQREGRYPGVSVPFVPGIEAAGTVLDAPAGSGFQTGDRVAWAGAAKGGYGEIAAVPAHGLMRVPSDISLHDAAALVEQALTADVLVNRVAHDLPVQPTAPAWAVVHAAGGGVGTWLTHMLVARGIKVLGIVSTEQKAHLVEAAGAVAIRNDNPDQPWRTAALAATGEARPRWVFDSVGKATFADSLDILAPCGHVVLYGAASGQVEPVDVVKLMVKSATLTRPVMAHYFTTQAELQAAADRVFALLRAHPELLVVHSEWSLNEASKAHEAMVSRERIGKVLIRVGGAR